MKHLWTLVVIASACGGEARPAPAPVAADGSTRAVVKLVRIDEEASNAGGTHYTFELDGPGAPRFVHGGGHGFALPDRDRSQTPQGFYIADVVPSPQPFHVRDGGWALGALPAYVGSVHRAFPVASHDEAVRLLPAGLDGHDRVPVDFTNPDQ